MIDPNWRPVGDEEAVSWQEASYLFKALGPRMVKLKVEAVVIIRAG